MARILSIALVASFFVVSTFGLTHVEFLLSARDLPDEDICCSPPVYPPDAYVVVYYSPSARDAYVQHGQTRILSNNNNPDWPDVYSFEVEEPTSARVKLDVMDSDVDADDYIGFAEVGLQEIIDGFGRQVRRPLTGPKNQGTIIVNGRVNGTSIGSFYIPALKNMAKRAREIGRTQPNNLPMTGHSP